LTNFRLVVGSESGGGDLPARRIVDEPGDGTIGTRGVLEACQIEASVVRGERGEKTTNRKLSSLLPRNLRYR
jgi:hypothetical protein